jgi:hypothetical protein
MKKIIAILSLSLAFTVSANAQDAKKVVSGAEKSKNEAYELKTLLGITDGLTADIYSLLEMKREVMENPNATAEKKAEMARIVGLKIQASLDTKQLEILMMNQEVYKRISGQTALNAEVK